MFRLSAQRKCPIELRELAMRLVVEARADTLTRRGAFTRIGGRARGPPTGVAHLGALWSRTGAMSAARSAISRLISASWKQRTGNCAAPTRSSKPRRRPGTHVLRIWSTAVSSPAASTSCGSPTSPTCARRPAGPAPPSSPTRTRGDPTPRRAGRFPGRGGIDNVYGPAGRIYSTTTAELDGKRREPGSNPYPAPAGPPRRAPEHHSPSTEPSTIHRPTPILTDNHNGYTQTIRRVLRY